METQTIQEIGVTGEKDVCNLLRSIGYPVRKSDGHIFINGQYCMVEVKSKSREFTPPPFKGHGLNLDQWDHYLDFTKRTGIRIILFIKCNGYIIWNYIDELEKGDTFITHKKKIILFPISNFKPFKELLFC